MVVEESARWWLPVAGDSLIVRVLSGKICSLLVDITSFYMTVPIHQFLMGFLFLVFWIRESRKRPR
jgi:hypothetical protein